MSKIRPKTSLIASLVGAVGLTVCVLSIVIIFYPEFKNVTWSDDKWLLFIIVFNLGFGLIILEQCIQKLWNIEFYLEHLANNSHQIPDYKPLTEQRKPQQDKPSDPQSA